jgi:5-methyltetrahydropteroyltriglutamate--homocysteine methyltransferase
MLGRAATLTLRVRQTESEKAMAQTVPIRTTVVGSYPVPDWLRSYPTRQGLRDAMMVVLKTQELAGIDLLADGELARFDVNHPETNGMIDYFIRRMSGIDTALSRSELSRFQSEEVAEYRVRPAGLVRGPIDEGTLLLADDFALARSLTSCPLKFTVTGPHMLSKVLSDSHYGARHLLSLALADVLAAQVREIRADAVQIDEANISGHPEESAWAAAAINRVLDAVRPGIERGVHICFGNYGGQSVQKGLWKSLMPFMNQLNADHLILEFARRGYAELELLRDIKPAIRLGIGVIDIKDNAVEGADTVAKRIEQATRTVGHDRIAYVHPDCGFWMLPRIVADRKMHALVQGKNRVLAAGN